MIFNLEHNDTSSKARAGMLETYHGKIETPIFMPVGTRAAVKTLTPRVTKELGAQIILGNTYHLLTRPGSDIVEKAGGLHKFMAWNKPILTDSGGFQVFSLAKLRKITDAGVTFQSHIDGANLVLGPLESMKIQQQLGADIAMVFDECPPSMADKKDIQNAVKRTLDWAEICYESNQNFNDLYKSNIPRQLLFGIGQGGIHDDLRTECIEKLKEIPFQGYAIGGLAVGEVAEEMYRITELSCDILPQNKPRYLMGVGTPENLVNSVLRGVDMFDCVMPTRNARNGTAFTDIGKIQIKAGKFKDDFEPVQNGCDCYTCQNFSKAYIRHLLNVGESLGGQLLTIHNIYFYLKLMRDMRKAIKNNKLSLFAKDFLLKYNNG